MAEIVNLNRFRKQKARAEKDAKAEQNRVKFGRTRDEKEQARAEDDIAARRLSAHRRDADDDSGDDEPQPA
ncbi:DUF4169 family protein [Tepidamorphus sp. 3E244]|uniref:DUF4169 family protein n=1 Tax=Tepidamorphus sp. 3E244 TaxID=3385498 RepID=UPI0038FD1499